MPERTYDADAQVGKMIPTDILIAGQSWKVRRTGTALKKIIELNPERKPGQDGGNPDDDAAANIDTLYESISVLLVDDQGEHPDPGKLSDELDFEVAQQLMSKFLPRRDEGNPTETVSEPATSTPT